MMKKLLLLLIWGMCSLTMLGEQHMMFRSLPIDGDLKTAMKEVKRWGFMGMKIKNVAALMGTLDGEDVMLTLMATPKTNTLFSVVVIYEGEEEWDKQLDKYNSINASIAAQYGKPSEIISEWEPPYSIETNPMQAFKEEKAMYGSIYTTSEGKVVVNIVSVEEKMCITVAYFDNQNEELFEDEGGIIDIEE